jgi:hypothetical protein
MGVGVAKLRKCLFGAAAKRRTKILIKCDFGILLGSLPTFAILGAGKHLPTYRS